MKEQRMAEHRARPTGASEGVDDVICATADI